jgi:hypothetical protein
MSPGDGAGPTETGTDHPNCGKWLLGVRRRLLQLDD